MAPDKTKAVRELLDFFLEAGVDALLADEPVDRFAARPAAFPPPETATAVAAPGGQLKAAVEPDPDRAAPASHQAPGAGRSTPAPVVARDAALMAAREAARSAATLEELRAMLESFNGCTLRQTAKKLVFADGNPQARVMFVGEAPGREEDLAGLPFVGRSGKLLDRMMAAIGLDRTSAYIANVIPWRPPGNRTPTPQEAAICLPFIVRQIELSNAQILVCLGGPSAQALLGAKDGILKARGRWLAYSAGGREIRAIATLHPAYLLRQPLQKRLAWRDFLAIKKALEGG
jgi:uracil-DNA glycosylase family 4